MTHCPECGQRLRNVAHHWRDTGDVTVLPDGACPVLFARRNLHLLQTTPDIDVQARVNDARRPFDWARDDRQLAVDPEPIRDLIDVDGFVYTTVG